MKIGYARVSTDAQETHLQMDALKRAKCSRIYEEKASGAKADRPEFMRLLDNARKGDVVVVWKLDRLARSLRQLIDTTTMLNERGVELHSLTENINTTTPSGKLTFHIFAALAEFERDILRQRVQRWSESRAATGACRWQAEGSRRSGSKESARLAAIRRLHQGASCRRPSREPPHTMARFIAGHCQIKR